MKRLPPFVLLLVCVSSNALSYQQTPSDIARTDPVMGATRKLGRGIANVGFGWMELFKGIQSVGQEKGFWAGVTWGPLYGGANAVKRTAVGVSEALTFPVAGPTNYQPILEPEFVLGDENSS